MCFVLLFVLIVDCLGSTMYFTELFFGRNLFHHDLHRYHPVPFCVHREILTARGLTFRHDSPWFPVSIAKMALGVQLVDVVHRHIHIASPTLHRVFSSATMIRVFPYAGTQFMMFDSLKRWALLRKTRRDPNAEQRLSNTESLMSG